MNSKSKQNLKFKIGGSNFALLIAQRTKEVLRFVLSMEQPPPPAPAFHEYKMKMVVLWTLLRWDWQGAKVVFTLVNSHTYSLNPNDKQTHLQGRQVFRKCNFSIIQLVYLSVCLTHPLRQQQRKHNAAPETTTETTEIYH